MYHNLNNIVTRGVLYIVGVQAKIAKSKLMVSSFER